MCEWFRFCAEKPPKKPITSKFNLYICFYITIKWDCQKRSAQQNYLVHSIFNQFFFLYLDILFGREKRTQRYNFSQNEFVACSNKINPNKKSMNNYSLYIHTNMYMNVYINIQRLNEGGARRPHCSLLSIAHYVMDDDSRSMCKCVLVIYGVV